MSIKEKYDINSKANNVFINSKFALNKHNKLKSTIKENIT